MARRGDSEKVAFFRSGAAALDDPSSLQTNKHNSSKSRKLVSRTRWAPVPDKIIGWGGGGWTPSYDGSCTNTADGATDPYGDGCTVYGSFPAWCGRYDDSDFSGYDMCCDCGGGVRTHPSDKTPTPPPEPTLTFSPTPAPM